MRIFFNRGKLVLAADVLGGVFIAQREILDSLRKYCLAGSDLKPETAEILIELYLAGNSHSSSELVDAEGFLAFRDLRAALGYSAGLLSRRISWLCQHHWTEVKRAMPSIAQGLHGNCQKIRITELGQGKIAPVWQGYDSLAQQLLADISPSDLAIHYRVNELIASKIRQPQFSLADRDVKPPHDHPAIGTRRARRTVRESMPAAFAPKAMKPPVSQAGHLFAEPEREFLD